MKKQIDCRYAAKINGMYFAGLSKDKVYADSTAQFAFHCLVNICANPDGMSAFEFTENIEGAERMCFFEASHNFIQMLYDRARYEYLPPIETLEIIEVTDE
jgi:hypothetical protein